MSSSSDTPEVQQPSNSSESGTHTQPPHFTFTFPIFFIPPQTTASPPTNSGNAPSASPNEPPQQQDNGQSQFPPEAIQHLVSHFLRAMPHIFMSAAGFPPQQFEPVPNGPPKKHATQSALDRLKPVDIATLPEGDRRCNICMQDYWIKPVGPRSPYVEDVKDEDEYQVNPSFTGQELTGQMEDIEPPAMDEVVGATAEAKMPEDAERPVQMPCGHVFGSTCLKEWLYQSPTCPLCRVEVESYVDDPQQSSFPFTPPQEGEPMQTGSQIPPPPQFAFQFIFASPPPQPTQPEQSQTPTPNISRPGTSHSIRHHPYARSSTVQSRPDLFCAQRQSGLCSHDEPSESDHLVRLDCGHAFHADCLDGAMLVEGYQPEPEGDERRCPRCRRWGRIQ